MPNRRLSTNGGKVAMFLAIATVGWLSFAEDAHAVKTLCEGKVTRVGVGMEGGVIASIETSDGRVSMSNVSLCTLRATNAGSVTTCQATLSLLEAAMLSNRSVIVFLDEAQATPSTVDLCRPPPWAVIEHAPYSFYFLIMK